MLYEYKGTLVEESLSFVYEVTVCKYWSTGFSELGNKIYQTNKLLHVKKKNYSIEHYDNYFIKKTIELIGVPKEFIIEYQLKPYTK